MALPREIAIGVLQHNIESLSTQLQATALLESIPTSGDLVITKQQLLNRSCTTNKQRTADELNIFWGIEDGFCKLFCSGLYCPKAINCPDTHDLGLRKNSQHWNRSWMSRSRSSSTNSCASHNSSATSETRESDSIVATEEAAAENKGPIILDTISTSTNIYAGCVPAPKAAFNLSSLSHKHLRKGPYFHLFSKLAPELRLKIWGHALEQPGIVRVGLYDLEDNNGRKTDTQSLKNLSSHCSHPLMLVCKESHAEASKKYRQRCLGLQPRTIFNYDNDCVYLDTKDILEIKPVLDALSDTDRACIRYVTMLVHDWADCNEAEFRERFWKFSRLEKLTLILGDDPKDDIYASCRSTASNVRQDLRDDREHRPPGWTCPKVEIIIIPNLKHRATGSDAVRFRR